MTRQARGSQEKEGREKNRKPEVIWDHLGSSGKSLKALGSLPGSPWEDFGGALGRLWGESGVIWNHVGLGTNYCNTS